MTVPGRGEWHNVDRGSATPLMMAVVALSLLASSVTARVGGVHRHMMRVDNAVDAVALALATGDRDLAQFVATRNRVRMVEVQMTGTVETGFDVVVAVAAIEVPGHHYVARARASTQP